MRDLFVHVQAGNASPRFGSSHLIGSFLPQGQTNIVQAAFICLIQYDLTYVLVRPSFEFGGFDRVGRRKYRDLDIMFAPNQIAGTQLDLQVSPDLFIVPQSVLNSKHETSHLLHAPFRFTPFPPSLKLALHHHNSRTDYIHAQCSLFLFPQLSALVLPRLPFFPDSLHHRWFL